MRIDADGFCRCREDLPEDNDCRNEASASAGCGDSREVDVRGVRYTPESGTIMKQNGKQIGKFVGKAFQTVLWDIYFGDNTCCSGLKESVFKSCTK
jgi:hypothetical protein